MEVLASYRSTTQVVSPLQLRPAVDSMQIIDPVIISKEKIFA